MPKQINPLMPMDNHLLNILSEDEVKDFKAMKAELQDTWVKKQMFRTETEMRISVLNDLKHPTPAAKYWQAVREQNVFFEQMVFLSFDYRRNEVEIKKLHKKIAEEKDELEKESLQIDLEQKTFDKAGMELTAKDRMRELRLWSELKDELVKQDPDFDKQNVNTHQQESLPKRLMKTFQFFDKANDADGAKNIAAQIMTAQRLEKEGTLKINTNGKGTTNDKSNPKLSQ
ncbi:hypothetical protein IDH09_01510 [Pelagibacterales bacterium SAG-MED28]|jgi:hypothetical protein|nr:hypothetical protein [Pelagibacterales bacterium SAG-MED28]